MAKPRRKLCPECGRRFEVTTPRGPGFPFCSERCKTLDLAKWIQGNYAIVEDLKRGHDLVENDDG